MDSINRQQPEDNREDLRGTDAVERIRDLVKKAETCFFCTAVSVGDSGATRPMSVQEVDEEGHLWFLSASDSHKNREITEAPSVRLFFQVSEHAGFLTLTGQATVSRDRKRIKKLWKPVLKTWFTEARATRASPSSGSRRAAATTGTTSTAPRSPASRC